MASSCQRSVSVLPLAGPTLFSMHSHVSLALAGGGTGVQCSGAGSSVEGDWGMRISIPQVTSTAAWLSSAELLT